MMISKSLQDFIQDEKLEMLTFVVDSGRTDWIQDMLQRITSRDGENCTGGDLIQLVAYEVGISTSIQN